MVLDLSHARRRPGRRAGKSGLPFGDIGIMNPVRRDQMPNRSQSRNLALQIIVNLINNAKQAVAGLPESERRVTVRVAPCGGQVELSVIDNGYGISNANMGNIFKHGFTTRADGHGFGLHSAANAAKNMGGTLVAQSDGEGCGATFTLTLPASQAEKGRAA